MLENEELNVKNISCTYSDILEAYENQKNIILRFNTRDNICAIFDTMILLSEIGEIHFSAVLSDMSIDLRISEDADGVTQGVIFTHISENVNDLVNEINEVNSTSIDNYPTVNAVYQFVQNTKKEIFDELPSNSPSVEIIDNLESTDTDKALSANQGRVLDEKIGDIESALDLILNLQTQY